MEQGPPESQGTLSCLYRQPGQTRDPVASSGSQNPDKLSLSSGTFGSGRLVLSCPLQLYTQCLAGAAQTHWRKAGSMVLHPNAGLPAP